MLKKISKRPEDYKSAPLFNQHIAANLLEKNIEEQKRYVNAGYRAKALLLKALFKSEMKSYILDFKGGLAGFYFFITLDNIETTKDSRFYKYLNRCTGDSQIDGDKVLKERVVYLPGVYCSSANEAKNQFRISYGYESEENLIKAVSIMAEACEYAMP